MSSVRNEHIAVLISAVLLNLLLSGCGPLAVVGAVGNVVNRTIQRKQDEKEQQYITDTRSAPDSGEIAITNLNVGVEYMRQGNYENALARLERARDAKPDYPPVYDMLGLLYQQMGQPADAEKNFKKALKLSRDNPGTLNNYGQFLCNQGREEEAEKYFLKVTKNPLYDTPEIPYTNLGSCALRQGRAGEAVDYFDKALSLNPNVPIALIHMSEIHYDRNEFIQAGNYLDRYHVISSPSPKSLWLGIRIKRELGDADAVSSYALLLRNQYPETDEARLLKESGIK